MRNEADKDIEVDTLLVRATYAGPRTVNYPSDATRYAGTRVQVGEEVDFALPEGRTSELPTSVEVVEFSFHTAGLSQCRSS
ncbi:MAG: hypothetical protein ACRDV9_14750 [Acidimicrobiia bacterium]